MFNLEHLEPKKTRKYPLRGISWPPTNPKHIELDVVHAGRANVEYTNASILTPEPDTSAAAPVEQLNAKDARLAKLVARHVIKGWSNVLGPDGNPVTYTPELGEQLLLEIIKRGRPGVIWGLAAFVGDPSNFDEPITSEEELGKG